jgi:hypothetical protein
VEVAIIVSRGGPMTVATMDLADPSTWRSIPEDQLRIVLARRDNRWVSAVRAGDMVTVDDVAGGGADWLATLVAAQLDGFHPVEPSRVAAINVTMDELRLVIARRSELAEGAPGRDNVLRTLGVRAADIGEFAALIDDPVAEAVLYARAYVDGETRSAASALDVRDTDAGRLATYRLAAVRGSTADWMTFAPGSLAQLEQGVRAVLASVDVTSWDNHRRM